MSVLGSTTKLMATACLRTQTATHTKENGAATRYTGKACSFHPTNFNTMAIGSMTFRKDTEWKFSQMARNIMVRHKLK